MHYRSAQALSIPELRLGIGSSGAPNNEDVESGSRESLTPGPHTTGRTGLSSLRSGHADLASPGGRRFRSGRIVARRFQFATCYRFAPFGPSG
jgi:hypothetical protein